MRARSLFLCRLAAGILRAPSASLGAFAPATGLWSSVTFGQSSSTFDARQIQLSLKVAF